MSSSATGVGMPICFLWAILLILTQKSSQKIGDVLGIMSRGAEKKVAKKPSVQLCLQQFELLERNKNALVKSITKANHKSSHSLSFWWIRVISIAMLRTDTTI